MINFLLAPFIAIGVMLGTLFAPVQESTLGASEAIPSTIAFFETTLASAISSTATSFTLTSATDKDGTTLASSTYAFVIDEGSSNEEIVIADCTGTACTNVERGISVRTGNTEVAALKKSHRRGASVKMTDAPILVLMARILRGEGTVDYTPSTGGNLVTKTYVDSLALGTTTVSSSETDDGLVELATQVEMSSSTVTGGSGAPLVLQSKYATSSCQVVGRYVPITDPLTGRIDAGCLDTTYASSSITIGSTPILDIGKWVYATTSYGTSTWTKQTGISRIHVTAVGGGGAGGTCTGSSNNGAAGGGAGGYVEEWIDVSGTSTVQFHVGQENENTTFGEYFTAGGGGDATANSAVGTGGTATGGDVNISGGPGTFAPASVTMSGRGGDSILGFGGVQKITSTTGSAGSGYGSGGSGGACTSGDGSNRGGGAGATGAIIIEY